jgi:hypothetical protein
MTKIEEDVHQDREEIGCEFHQNQLRRSPEYPKICPQHQDYGHMLPILSFARWRFQNCGSAAIIGDCRYRSIILVWYVTDSDRLKSKN